MIQEEPPAKTQDVVLDTVHEDMSAEQSKEVEVRYVGKGSEAVAFTRLTTPCFANEVGALGPGQETKPEEANGNDASVGLTTEAPVAGQAAADLEKTGYTQEADTQENPDAADPQRLPTKGASEVDEVPATLDMAGEGADATGSIVAKDDGTVPAAVAASAALANSPVTAEDGEKGMDDETKEEVPEKVVTLPTGDALSSELALSPRDQSPCPSAQLSVTPGQSGKPLAVSGEKGVICLDMMCCAA